MTLAGSLAYDSYSASSSVITLENKKTITPTDDGVTLLVALNMDASAQPQVDTITISNTLPVANCYYRVLIDDYTTNAAQMFVYFYDTASTDTSSTIAAALAALINSNRVNRPDVSAVATTNTIAVSSMLPGTNGAFTSTVTCKAASDGSDVSGSPISKTTANGSGTGRVRSVGVVTVEMLPTASTSTSPSFPEFRLSGTWYNGAASPTTQSSIPSTKFTGPLSLDALRNVV